MILENMCPCYKYHRLLDLILENPIVLHNQLINSLLCLELVWEEKSIKSAGQMETPGQMLRACALYSPKCLIKCLMST